MNRGEGCVGEQPIFIVVIIDFLRLMGVAGIAEEKAPRLIVYAFVLGLVLGELLFEIVDFVGEHFLFLDEIEIVGDGVVLGEFLRRVPEQHGIRAVLRPVHIESIFVDDKVRVVDDLKVIVLVERAHLFVGTRRDLIVNESENRILVEREIFAELIDAILLDLVVYDNEQPLEIWREELLRFHLRFAFREHDFQRESRTQIHAHSVVREHRVVSV